MFDKNNLNSFNEIDFWIRAAKNNANSDASLFLIGNKSDLPSEISSEEALIKALLYEMLYVEISVKTNDNVELLLRVLQRELVYKRIN